MGVSERKKNNIVEETFDNDGGLIEIPEAVKTDVS